MAECDLETWNRSRYIHIGMISVGSMLVMATCMCSCTCVVYKIDLSGLCVTHVSVMHAHGCVGGYCCNRVDSLCVGAWCVCSFLMCVYEKYHGHLKQVFFGCC